MLTFREAKNRCRIEGFQCHHLIPIEIVEHRAFAQFFGLARSQGFNPNDFITNGMHLPSCEKQAAAFRLPLHRGGHPLYNSMVAERISQIVQSDAGSVKNSLSKLQLDLRTGLRARRIDIGPGLRRPMLSAVDFRRIDAEAELLWPSSRWGAGTEE